MKYTVQTVLSKRLPVNGTRQDRELRRWKNVQEEINKED